MAVIIDLNFNNSSDVRVLNGVLNQVNCHLLESLVVAKQILRHKSEFGRVPENVPFEQGLLLRFPDLLSQISSFDFQDVWLGILVVDGEDGLKFNPDFPKIRPVIYDVLDSL